MSSVLLGLLVCLSPLAFVAVGYAWGRYGLPVEVRRRRLVDRRRAAADPDEADPEIYRAEVAS